jgi:hypothetical protein
MAEAVFNYTAWAAMFPELANGGVTSTVADIYFTSATFLLDNSKCSVVRDPKRRLFLLNYIVAHLASIGGYPLPAGATGPAGPSGMVGRVANATEGTVSVGSDMGPVTNQQAWWLQSQYGATYWEMTRYLRTMRYVAAPARNFAPRIFTRW